MLLSQNNNEPTTDPIHQSSLDLPRGQKPQQHDLEELADSKLSVVFNHESNNFGSLKL